MAPPQLKALQSIMMNKIILFLRSTIFNVAFFGVTAFLCVACLPGLFMPKKQALYIVRAFALSVYFLEKHILGLDYEVRGLEHVPRYGSFIVAAKHQSPYETMKLDLLFNDPAIVLKRELFRIPLWGWFLAKIEPIAINRNKGRNAMEQIIAGANRIKDQGRPIVIFPQGTRVYPWQTPADKPYKIGVARMAVETGMTIVPLALNAGVFWPRGSWIKKPGKVIFEFLPPVKKGLGVYEIIKDLENRIEDTSNRLAQQ